MEEELEVSMLLLILDQQEVEQPILVELVEVTETLELVDQAVVE